MLRFPRAQPKKKQDPNKMAFNVKFQNTRRRSSCEFPERTKNPADVLKKSRARLDLDILNSDTALAGVAQWVGHLPAGPRVASSTPRQGTCLDY